jgi:hypothetical protein
MIKSDRLTYLFFSIKPKPLVRTFSAGLILMFMVYFIFRIPVWTIPVAVAAGHLVYICSRVGWVRLSKDHETITIVIRDLFKTATLTTPVTIQRWWSYGFYVHPDDTESEPAQGAPNDLHVFLVLKDEQNHEVAFAEYIGFDTRFPNECPYADRTIEADQMIFRVQRVDKLYSFLQRNLAAHELLS